MPPLPIRVTLSLVVLIAAAADLRSRRIPNWLTFAALPAGLAAQAVYGDGLPAAVLGACAAFAVYFALFAIGAKGGGDVKLFAVVGAFVGIQNLLLVFVLISLVGGIAAVAVGLRAGALGRIFGNVGALIAAAAAGRWADFRLRSDVSQPGAMRLAGGVVTAAGALLFLWFPR